MRYRLVAALACAAVLGCATTESGIVDPEARKRRYPEKPLEIIGKKSATQEAQAPVDPAVQRVMDDIRKQQEALAQAQKAGMAAKPAPVSVESTAAAPVEAQAAAGKNAAPLVTVESTGAVEELSVQHLIDRLATKTGRTPEEQEAYRRLLGATSEEPPASAADEYGLLAEAQAAILDGRMEDAQDKANEALALIRRKTDPRIDRVCLAWQASSYGDAELAEPAEFSVGQAVLAVTDLSDFACLPVGTESPPKLYYVKMSQRLAVYDKDGKLRWEYAHGPFEYQASHYFSTMFIPVRVTIPNDMTPGEYVLKVEITDVLAGRQAESSTDFRVK